MADPIDISIKKAFIKKQACFAQLNEEEDEVLASLLVEKHFAAGDTIVTEGDPVDSVYLIVSGTADVRHVSIQDGKEEFQSIASLGPDTSIGLSETGFYSLSGVRTATVVAKTAMVTLRLSVAAFNGFALSNTHVTTVMRKHASSIMGFGEKDVEK